jgi:hypothetical protein
MAKSSTVFISYSHDSPEHEARVLGFAARLVTEGIEAQLDQWNQEPDDGWALWTERQITNSDFVIVVCTNTYCARVASPDGESAGAGAFWEARIIRTCLYEAKGGGKKFVPVYFGSSEPRAIPTMLKDTTRYQIDSPEGYIALYRRLTRQPKIERPELGELVVLPRKSFLPGAGGEALLPTKNEFRLTEALSFKKLSPAQVCDERKLKSTAYSVRTYIRFDNYLAEDVALYWLNYQGERVYYATLQPGRSYLAETFVTHPWVITRLDVRFQGKCLAVFEPEFVPGVAEIR